MNNNKSKSSSKLRKSAKQKGESMRKLILTIFVVMLLLVPAATADTTPAKSQPTATKSARPSVAGPAKKTETVKKLEPAKKNEPSAVEVELQQVKELLLQQAREMEAQRALLRQQQEKMEEMERRIQEGAAANSHGATQEPDDQQNGRPGELKVLEGQLEAVADATNALNQKVAKVEKDVTANKTAAEGKLRALGNFSFGGDLRLRAETFDAGTLTQGRYRARYRLRFNVGAKLTDELSGGLTIASGDATDPVSTNQSFTGFFTRKYFSIDRAFLNYKPKWFKNALRGDLDLTGGKYVYSWYRTPLTFDNDLNPEGLSQSVSWSFKSSPLERITLVGVQNFINESGGGKDAMMYGGQVQLAWKLGDWVRVATYGGFFDFRNTDAIRVALNNLNSAATAVTGGACATTPGCTVTVGIPGTAALSGNAQTNSASTTQYASKFGIADTAIRFDIKTPVARWPIMTQLNYVINTRACTNRTATGLPVVATCNPKDRDGYLAEFLVGRLQERNDFQFGYGYFHIQREAVLAPFNESDLRQATNLAQNRITFGWQTYRNVQVIWSGWFGRQLVTGTAAKEKTLRRLQFDLIYRF